MKHLKNKNNFIVTGAFGSGKTEFSINLATYLSQNNEEVLLGDLDVINTYFRSRQRAEPLNKDYGIKVISSQAGLQNADIPALAPGLHTIFDKDATSVIDVGGDQEGAVILKGFRKHFSSEHCLLIHIFNPFRPYTDTLVKIKELNGILECMSGLTTGLLVANPNLGLETNDQHINDSLPFIKEVAEDMNIPLIIAKDETLTATISDFETFEIKRYMKLPFEAHALPSI